MAKKVNQKEVCTLIDNTDSNELYWKVNTAQLIKEILSNNETGVLSVPLTIFSRILAEVGARASELDDPKLNALMCRLAIYDVADPYSENYDNELVNSIIETANKKIVYTDTNLEGKFIKVINHAHAKKVIDFFSKHGYDVRGYSGCATVQSGSIYCYYGVIDGWFDNGSLENIIERGCEIIELPKETQQPKVRK